MTTSAKGQIAYLARFDTDLEHGAKQREFFGAIAPDAASILDVRRSDE
jgi:hypothetical protein